MKKLNLPKKNEIEIEQHKDKTQPYNQVSEFAEIKIEPNDEPNKVQPILQRGEYQRSMQNIGLEEARGEYQRSIGTEIIQDSDNIYANNSQIMQQQQGQDNIYANNAQINNKPDKIEYAKMSDI